MKQADQLQPWTLCFRARAKCFDFKFKNSKILPICKFFRLSIRFKLRPFTVELESKTESAFSLKRKLLQLKFLQKFKVFRRKRSGNKGTVEAWLARKSYWCGRRKKRIWFWILLFAVVGCFMVMQLRSYFRTIILWKFFWMAWNYAAPSGFLHQFFKVIFDGPSRSLVGF